MNGFTVVKKAVSVAGDYVIRERSGGDVRLSLPETSGWTRYPSHAEAKAAAQADYERRIRSALESTPPVLDCSVEEFGGQANG
jgi:hypothetical protein